MRAGDRMEMGADSGQSRETAKSPEGFEGDAVFLSLSDITMAAQPRDEPAATVWPGPRNPSRAMRIRPMPLASASAATTTNALWSAPVHLARKRNSDHATKYISRLDPFSAGGVLHNSR